MPELNWSMMVAGLAVLLAVAAWATTVGMNRRLGNWQREAAERQRDHDHQLALLRQSISGLTAGAVGIDRRLMRLEDREKLLAERQETYENQQTDEQPYGQAIRLVHQGAGVNRLVDELELSESEADLLVRLHGQRNTA